MDFFLNLMITWSVGLVLPLLIRFAFVRRPLNKKIASWIAFGNSAILWIFFTVLLLLIGERDPSYGFAWVLVFFVAKAILSSRPSDIEDNKGIADEPILVNDKAETMQTNEKEVLGKSDSQVERISIKSETDKKQNNKLLLVIITIAIILIPITFVYVYYYLPVASISLDQNSVTL